MSLLELHDVRKTYPGVPPVESVRGVSMAVEAGEMVAICGPSGSGKSTLLNLMSGLDRPTSGSVILDGHRLESLTDRQRAGLRAYQVGVIFQAFFLLESLTALDNVATGLLYRAVPERRRRAAATEALTRVGLRHRIGHPVTKLSGGERQRVAIARATAGRPAIVFADEPTGNLDSATGQAILDLMCELNRDGVTIAVITHDEHVAAACTRRIAVRDGRISWPGFPA